ncbi:MAG: radical SAM protein [Fibrobacterota bacterium]|nr:radical SAM protein [Fibrobacterota bacterium]
MPPRNPDLQREQSHHPREFADFVYTYPVVSRRSGGISIGVNLNLDKFCNFDCPYCQVDRTVPKPKQAISVPAIRAELEKLLDAFDDTGVCRLDRFSGIPDADKRLKDIAISGDGEPTMVPEFAEVCAMLATVQSARPTLDFKLILITNSTLLDRDGVLEGIGHLLSKSGEIWAKLDAGTEEWYQKVNISRVSLDRVEANLIRLGGRHPFKIQSLFCGLDGVVPPQKELDAYLERLKRIRDSGSDILEVQLHTLARKPAQANCTPVTTAILSDLQAGIESAIAVPARVYGMET